MTLLGRYREAAPDVSLDIVLTDRKLSASRMPLCAAPSDLTRSSTPSHPSDLAHHDSILFTPAGCAPWRLTRGGETIEIAPRTNIQVNNGQALRVAAQAGLGIILQPIMLVGQDIAAGRLVQILPDWSLGERAVSLLYYRDRRMTPRLSSFIAFAMKKFRTGDEGNAP